MQAPRHVALAAGPCGVVGRGARHGAEAQLRGTQPDFDGHGRRDIWTSKPDVLGSIANYLAESGWRSGQTWGQQVTVPPGMEVAGRDVRRSLSDWARAGVRPLEGRWAGPGDTPAGLVAPDGAGGETFAMFGNFAAIRRYNPSDYYALSVGLIGDQVAE